MARGRRDYIIVNDCSLCVAIVPLGGGANLKTFGGVLGREVRWIAGLRKA